MKIVAVKRAPVKSHWVPSLLLEASIWEPPTVEAGCFGASAVVCVGAGGIGPSEVLLTLLPSWPVGGTSMTTD